MIFGEDWLTTFPITLMVSSASTLVLNTDRVPLARNPYKFRLQLADWDTPTGEKLLDSKEWRRIYYTHTIAFFRCGGSQNHLQNGVDYLLFVLCLPTANHCVWSAQ